jgi:hypothetical protein
VGAIDVFVSNDNDFVFVLGGNGLHRLRVGISTDAVRVGLSPVEISLSIHYEINHS